MPQVNTNRDKILEDYQLTLKNCNLDVDVYERELKKFDKLSDSNKLRVSIGSARLGLHGCESLHLLNVQEVKNFRKDKAEKLFQHGLNYFLIGLPPELSLLQSLLADKETAKFQASLLEDFSEDLNEFLEIFKRLEKLGVTGHELDDFFPQIKGGK